LVLISINQLAHCTWQNPSVMVPLHAMRLEEGVVIAVYLGWLQYISMVELGFK
jgi:hypothetical protein